MRAWCKRAHAHEAEKAKEYASCLVASILRNGVFGGQLDDAFLRYAGLSIVAWRAVALSRLSGTFGCTSSPCPAIVAAAFTREDSCKVTCMRVLMQLLVRSSIGHRPQEQVAVDRRQKLSRRSSSHLRYVR